MSVQIEAGFKVMLDVIAAAERRDGAETNPIRWAVDPDSPAFNGLRRNERPLSPAVRTDDFVFVSGMAAIDPATGDRLHGTVAADPNYVPLGAPVFIRKADRPEIDGIWVAQDTGGAIKGPNRFDTFWGAGPEAVAIAGGMSASGEALILVPKGAAARALPQP